MMKMNQMAGGQKENDSIIFRNSKHAEFYREALQKCRKQDSYHKALVYCLGIDRITREHASRIFEFDADGVRPICMRDNWQTPCSMKIVRLAFNLYCDSIPTAIQMEDPQELMQECREYFPNNLFCCECAPYFWQAIRIRYPAYCGLKSEC